MTIKDLSSDTDLKYVKVKIPDDHGEWLKQIGLDQTEVYIKSVYHSGVWVSRHPNEDRVFPITPVYDLLDWEVVDGKYRSQEKN